MEQKLKKYRKEKHMSQEQLAKKSGVSRVTISKIETGEQKVTTTTTILALANALDVPVADLI